MVRIFGSPGRSRRLRSSIVALAAITAMAITIPAALAHLEVTLPGATFEIDTDANLKVDHTLDWANVAETRRADQPTGSHDDSFGQGTKEDTAVPTVVDGSIPPNKSDLLNFGVYLETNADGRFLNLFWHRVQEPSGTTNMDFEFNQSSTISANGVTPVRTAGDVLVQYDLSQGGSNPVLFVSRWVTTGAGSQCQASNSVPCWSTKTNLSAAGDAAGSINTSAIPAAEADGLGNISARTFGEAQLDFDALTGGGAGSCTSFGSAYLKSRSSDSFSAALKDFIAPATLNLSRCGSVKITKTDDATPGNPLAGAEFTLYVDNTPVGGTRGVEDTITTKTCTTGATGVCTILGVFEGNYWVVETVTPPGHDTAADQTVTVVANAEVSVTFVNPRQRGAILITKTRKHAADGSGDHAHAGVTFTVNGTTAVTDANGEACVDDLLFGDYTVSETVPPGYAGEADKTVTVDTASTCGDGNEAEVSFSNTPLTNLTVSVDSQVDGGTASTIDCGEGEVSTDPNGDGSTTLSDLPPGTYTCTILIDP